MDKSELVQRRRGRYLAQTLDQFELIVESHVPPGVAQAFKGTVRAKFNALAVDATDIYEREGVQNGVAAELRDHVHPNGPPAKTRSTTR